MADDRRDQVLAAAKAAFLRFGYRRVGMNDIAEAAGISRPSLYLVFKSKEDIFKAVYRQWTEQTLDEIARGRSSLRTPGDRLRFALDRWAVQAFEAARQSPEAAELIGCTLGFAADEVRAGDEAFAKCLASIIGAHAAGRSPRHKLTPARVARVVVSAVHGFKQTAADASELRRLIDDLLTLYLT